MTLARIAEALLRPYLGAGLVAGLLGVAVLAAPPRRGAPGWGVGLAAAALAAMLAVGILHPAVAAGVVLLVMAGVAQVRRVTWAAALLLLAGAAVIATALPGEPSWLRPVAAAAVVVGGLTLASFGSSPWARWAPALVVVTVGGVFVTVPDTEAALALLGAAAAVAGAALVMRWPLTPPGAFAVAGLVVWAAGSGGWPRPGSVVGGLACFGVLAVAPAWWAVTSRSSWGPDLSGATVLVSGHITAVLVAGRIAGMRTGALEALPMALLALAVAAGAVVCAAWLSRPQTRATLSGTPPSEGPRRGAT